MKDCKTQYQLWKYWLDHPPFLWYDVCMAMVSSGLDWSGHISLVWSNIYWSKVVCSCLVWSRPSSLVQSGVVLKKDFKWALIIWTQSTTILAKRRQTNERRQPCDPRASLLLTSQKSIIWQFYIHVRDANGTLDRNYCISHVVCDLSCVVCGMWLVICHQFPK